MTVKMKQNIVYCGIQSREYDAQILISCEFAVLKISRKLKYETKH